jgi:uncharacterized protein YidB (DUF937 family)
LLSIAIWTFVIATHYYPHGISADIEIERNPGLCRASIERAAIHVAMTLARCRLLASSLSTRVRSEDCQLNSSLGGASAGRILSGGLGDLLDRFEHSGQGETAESWVKTGPDKPCSAAQLEQALGPEVLDTLSKRTGLSRHELVARLCRELPDAVDKYAPQGRIPTEAEPSRS